MTNNILSNKNIELLEGVGTPLSNSAVGPTGSIYIDRSNGDFYTAILAGSSAGWSTLSLDVSNGLTAGTGGIKLGGALIENTTITGSYDFEIQSYNNKVGLRFSDTKGALGWSIGSNDALLSYDVAQDNTDKADFGSIYAKEAVAIIAGSSASNAQMGVVTNPNTFFINYKDFSVPANDRPSIFQINAGEISIATGASGNQSVIRNNNVTANRYIEFPDADGTLLLSESATNGLTAGTGGIKLGGALIENTLITGAYDFEMQSYNNQVLLKTQDLKGALSWAIGTSNPGGSLNGGVPLPLTDQSTFGSIAVLESLVLQIGASGWSGSVTSVEYSNEGARYYATESSTGNNRIFLDIKPNLLGIQTGSTALGNLKTDNLTASRDYQFPDADGTLLLDSSATNGLTAGTGGIKLGGALIENTTITGGYDLEIKSYNNEVLLKTQDVKGALSWAIGTSNPGGSLNAGAPLPLTDQSTFGSIAVLDSLVLQIGASGYSGPVTSVEYSNQGARYYVTDSSTGNNRIFLDIKPQLLGIQTGSTAMGNLKTDNLTSARDYQFPDADGTLALTSDVVGSYLPLIGGTMSGAINFGSSSVSLTNDGTAFNLFAGDDSQMRFGTAQWEMNTDGDLTILDNYTGPTRTTNIKNLAGQIWMGTGSTFGQLDFQSGSLTATRTWTMPDASGTVSLTSDLVFVTGSGTNSIKAIGDGTNTSSGSYSFTLGQSNTAIGSFSNIFGFGNTASSSYNRVSGRNNNTSGDYSLTHGDANTATTGTNKITFGVSNTNTGTHGFVAGLNNSNTGTYAAIFGRDNINGGLYSIIGGYLNTGTTSSYSITVGRENLNNGLYSSVTGLGHTATGDYTVVNGQVNVVTANHAGVFGRQNTVSDAYGFCAGYLNTVGKSYVFGYNNNLSTRIYSVAGGSNHTITSDYSTAFGNNNIISTDDFCVAMGNGNTVSGLASVALGQANTVSGVYSSTIGGLNNTANNSYSTVIGGQNNTSSGQHSLTFGFGNTASGNYSVAGGFTNQAINSNSTAFGYLNQSTGPQSFSVNNTNLASGTNSFAINQLNTASGLNSFVGGYGSTGSAWGNFIHSYNSSVSANYSAILGGTGNTITEVNSAIIGGETNSVGGANSAIIGGTGLTNNKDNTVMVPNLAVEGGMTLATVGVGASIKTLGIDASGNIVEAAGGGSSNALVENFMYSFTAGVDNLDFFDDGNCRFGWDAPGNDLEFYMDTEPAGATDLRSLATLNYATQQNTAITTASNLYDLYSAGVAAGNQLSVIITAYQDAAYPMYQVDLYNTGTFVTIKITKTTII